MKAFILVSLVIFSAFAVGACNTTEKKSGDHSAKQGAGVKIDSTLENQNKTQLPDTGIPGTAGPNGTGTIANPTNPGTTPTNTVTPAASGCYKADASICAIEAEILRLTNEERAHPTKMFQSPHTALKAAPKLGFVARDWSKKQAARGSIGHDGFPDRRMAVFSKEFPNAQADISGENVAMTGFDDGAIAKQFFKMWLNSPGHYANMMGEYVAMGVGVTKSDDGWYATECFGEEQ